MMRRIINDTIARWHIVISPIQLHFINDLSQHTTSRRWSFMALASGDSIHMPHDAQKYYKPFFLLILAFRIFEKKTNTFLWKFLLQRINSEKDC